MRHRVKGRHLARTAEHRRALYRNLIAALFEHGRIRTTDAKAREIRPMAEKMITLGKRGDVHARRQAVRVLGDSVALARLFGPIAERFAERPGGYTRMVKAGRRHGDAAPIAYIELLDEPPRVVRAPAETETKEPERKGARGRRAAPASGTGARGGSKPAGAGGTSRKKAASEESGGKRAKSGKAAKGGKAAERGASKASRRGPRKGGDAE